MVSEATLVSETADLVAETADLVSEATLISETADLVAESSLVSETADLVGPALVAEVSEIASVAALVPKVTALVPNVSGVSGVPSLPSRGQIIDRRTQYFSGNRAKLRAGYINHPEYQSDCQGGGENDFPLQNHETPRWFKDWMRPE